MAEWLKSVSGKFKRMSESFMGGKPLAESLPQMLNPSDPRVAIRPVGDDWLCPFTGQRVVTPDWNGSPLTLLQSPTIKQHLLAQPELQKLGAKAQMKTFPDLAHTALMFRLSLSPNHKFAAPKGEWVCPYCMERTEILLRNWDGSDADPKFFMPEALKHLAQCEAHKADPINGAHTIAELSQTGGDRAKIKRYLNTDPRFRLCDASGAWLCPYSGRTVASINLRREAWGPGTEEKILNYVMSPDCPGKYSQFEVERSLEDLTASSRTKPALL
jgi:hypothetical protein